MEPELYELPTGSIRSISLGDPKEDQMKFIVGNTYLRKTPNELQVVEIIRDTNNYHLYGVIRYIIYAKKTTGDEAFAWKYLENQRVTVECFIDETTA